MPSVTVVGAGVVGLSCAIRLAEAGHAVRILAERRTPDTTSDAAAAIWFPYLVEPRERVQAWCRASLARFRSIARTAPEAGVAWSRARVHEPTPETPWWGELVDGLRRAPPTQGDPPGRASWLCEVPTIHMPSYMRYLEALAGRLGVARLEGRLRGLPPGLVVNCAGLGARELVGDTSLVAVRGQVARIEWRLPEALFVEGGDPTAPTYAIPRADGTILGGTAQPGDEDLGARDVDEAAFLDRLAAHLGPLGPVVARKVGLRPGRPAVRLELERRAGRAPAVHCYGHGGAGVTLSWGCADEVAHLVRTALQDQGPA